MLLAVLKLLEAKAGPLLEDLPEGAPDVAEGDKTGFACAVNFGRESAATMDFWRSQISDFAAWHRLAVDQCACSTAALCGVVMVDAAQYVFEHAHGRLSPSISWASHAACRCGSPARYQDLLPGGGQCTSRPACRAGSARVVVVS